MDRLFEIVDEALKLPQDERDAYLLEACAGNAELLTEARRLVAADLPSDFLEPPSRPGGPHFTEPQKGAQLGDFELQDEIGRGGMGLVYRARQLSLDRVVAVKVLIGLRSAHPLALERFRREALAASRLDHPALVSVMASGVEDDCAWFAMPLIEGHDLHAELTEQAIGNYSATLLPDFGTPAYTTAVATQIAHLAEGLEHAHAEGVVHRDVKPRNILLDREGKMQLADFGLAKSAGDQTITETGALQGTPFYMSPEQTRALRDPIGPRSDVYSLSVVLYELLTLRRPFQGEDLQDLLNKISSGTPLKLRAVNSRIPRDLCVICETGMAHRPKDRYASAQALAQDLHRFLAGEPILARPLPVMRRAARWMGKHPWRTAIPAALVAVVATALIAGRAERRRSLQEGVLTPMEVLQGAQTPSPQELNAAWVALQGIDTGRVPGLQDEASVKAGRARINLDIETRLDLIDTAFLEGNGPRFDARFQKDLELAPDAARLLDGILLATESSALYPGHPELEARANLGGILPRISARVADSLLGGQTAEVLYQTVDALTGDISTAATLGTAPIIDLPVAPGRYRFTAVLTDGRFAEVERELEFGAAALTLTFWPRSQESVEARCVWVQPASEDFPSGTRIPQCWIPQFGAPLAPFWIAASELSNRDYLEYLRGTSAAPPEMWTDAGFDATTLDFQGPRVPKPFDFERWLTLPCVLVPYQDLRLATEWFGLRVPTHAELEYALRGEALRLRPVFEALDSQPLGGTASVLDRPRFAGDPTEGGLYFYVCSQLEATPWASARTAPLGLFHPLGNVAEYTSSPALAEVSMGANRRLARVSGHLALGGSWLARSPKGDLSLHQNCVVEPGSVSMEAGVRPARSPTAPTP